jgi:hypothetical protein
MADRSTSERRGFEPTWPGLAVPSLADQAGLLEYPDVLRHGLHCHGVRLASSLTVASPVLRRARSGRDPRAASKGGTYPRCACRGDDGKRLGGRCPTLAANAKRGRWLEAGAPGKLGHQAPSACWASDKAMPDHLKERGKSRPCFRAPFSGVARRRPQLA